MSNAGLVDRIRCLMVTAALCQRHQRKCDEPDRDDRAEAPTRLATAWTCQDGQILDARPGLVDQIRQRAGARLNGALSGFNDILQGTRHLGSLRFSYLRYGHGVRDANRCTRQPGVLITPTLHEERYYSLLGGPLRERHAGRRELVAIDH